LNGLKALGSLSVLGFTPFWDIDEPQDNKLEEVTKLITKLDEFLQVTKLSKKEMLLHQSWLLHWSLFPIFKESAKPDAKLLDLFLSERSITAVIPLSCPHLYRYVGACLVLQKRYTTAGALKETVKRMHQEGSNYTDPITRFLFALYIGIDFDQAQKELQQCRLVCKSDYFLFDKWVEFQENARLLIFETYCRIHQCINIGMLASRLNMSEEEADEVRPKLELKEEPLMKLAAPSPSPRCPPR